MASKSKSRNLNYHKGKGCIKVQRRFVPKVIKKSRGGDFVYVALDTNILFNLIDVITQRNTFRSLKEYEQMCSKARFFTQNNVYTQKGYFNSKGRIVFVILPNVLKEAMTNKKYAKHRQEIARLIENEMLVLNFDVFKESEYAMKTQPLVKELKKQGFFMKDGQPTQDLINFTQAAVLNLTLITQDADFGVDSQKSIHLLRSICNRKLQGDHNGFMAEPMKFESFIELFEKDSRFSTVENVQLLDKASQDAVTGKIPPNKHLKKEKEKELV